MITFILLSLFIYYLTPILLLKKYTFSVILGNIKFYYNNLSFLLFFLFLILSGIPPFIFFFIKFSILVYFISYWDFIIIFFNLIYVFISMLFYLQFFKIRTKTHLKLNDLNKTHILQLNKNLNNVFKYKLIYCIVYFFLLNFTSFMFITDFYIVILNFVN